MDSPEFEDASPRQYVPSGWFSVLVLPPLLVLGIVVALVMGVVLLLLENNFYYYFFTPGIVGIPVFVAVWAVVRLSHCRNPLVGTLVGLVLGVIYYVGYWELSYLANVVVEGPGAVALVEKMGGAPGLPGYINFRCKMSKPVAHHGAAPAGDPTKVDYAFNIFFFCGEAIVIGGLALAIGRSNAKRVYYESHRRWSSKCEFRLPPATLATVLRAVEARDWDTIAALPRVSSTGNANAASLLFRVEYLAGPADSPLYLSLSGANLGKAPAVDGEGNPIPKPKGWFFLNQVAVEPEAGPVLARHFPEIKITPTGAAREAGPRSVIDAPVRLEPVSPAPREPVPLAPVPSGGDFRDGAVAATRTLLTEEEQEHPGDFDASSCLPTGEGRRAVRSAAWWPIKLQLLTFALFFAALGLAAWAEQVKDAQGRQPSYARALVWVGGIGAVADGIFMLVALFCATNMQKPLLGRRLARRPGSLLDGWERLPSRILRLENAKTYHKQKLSPEDVCLCVFDAPNRRILLEGVSYRYLIRADDVATLWPLQSGDKISIQIDYRIGEEALSVVLAADNPLSHVFHGVFAHRPFRALVRRFGETLGREVVTG